MEARDVRTQQWDPVLQQRALWWTSCLSSHPPSLPSFLSSPFLFISFLSSLPSQHNHGNLCLESPVIHKLILIMIFEGVSVYLLGKKEETKHLALSW